MQCPHILSPVRLALGAVLAVTAAAPSILCAQVLPTPDRTDPRLASVHWSEKGQFRLEIPLDRDVTVLLPRGESLSSVNVAAPGNWVVDAHAGGEAFAIRPLRPVPDTTMTVLSTARSYSFVLAAASGGSPPVLIRITGTPSVTRARASGALQVEPTRAAPIEASATWRLSGRRELWPSSIRDDGTRTYIEWPADEPIPAVFAIDRLGREEMVNGYMRGTIFTIDRVYQHLLLRIDKAAAHAERRVPGRRAR